MRIYFSKLPTTAQATALAKKLETVETRYTEMYSDEGVFTKTTKGGLDIFQKHFQVDGNHEQLTIGGEGYICDYSYTDYHEWWKIPLDYIDRVMRRTVYTLPNNSSLKLVVERETPKAGAERVVDVYATIKNGQVNAILRDEIAEFSKLLYSE